MTLKVLMGLTGQLHKIMTLFSCLSRLRQTDENLNIIMSSGNPSGERKVNNDEKETC